MVSYNVLSQYLFDMHPELYEGARPEDTAWEVRGPRIWAQLMTLQPDVSKAQSGKAWVLIVCGGLCGDLCLVDSPCL